jgi:ankyrin repeat protein
MKKMTNSLKMIVLSIILCLIPGYAFSETNSDLHQAAASGDIDIIVKLIAGGADINGKDEIGATPLMAAAAKGQIKVMELLLNRGADINAKTETEFLKGYTALIAATSADDTEAAKILIEKGADVNAKMQDRWSPLVIATVLNNKGIVEILLKHGADKTNLEKDVAEFKKVYAKESKGRYGAHLQVLRNDLKMAFMAALTYFMDHPGAMITKLSQLEETGLKIMSKDIVFVKADISETAGGIVLKSKVLDAAHSIAAKDLLIGEGMVNFMGELYLPALK